MQPTVPVPLHGTIGAPVLLVTLALAALAGPAQQQPGPPSLRLHHFHIRTADVTAALARAAAQHGGSRVLLQGLGVGVRVRDHYLLFDRSMDVDGEPAHASGEALTHDAGEAYRAAARWLVAHGLAVTPGSLEGRSVAVPGAGDVLDHVAFATTNLEAAIGFLRASGVPEARRTGDSVFFRAHGVLIEITSDTDLPETLWCPMHPDVRASSPGKCPICSMDLVTIPPRRLGEYRLDVAQIAAPGGKGTRALTFRIREPNSGEPVRIFLPLHERLLHVFVVSHDLRFFAHEHPQQSDDRFDLPMRLAPGAYMVIADFLPAGGSPQMVHRAIVTPGYAGSPFRRAPQVVEDLSDKVIDGVRVRLTVERRSGRLDAILRFAFGEAPTGEPLTDLQPYLGASGHLLIVSDDLIHAVHAHPEEATSGPVVPFAAEFPGPGVYKVWVQVLREGKIITAPFVIRVTND